MVEKSRVAIDNRINLIKSGKSDEDKINIHIYILQHPKPFGKKRRKQSQYSEYTGENETELKMFAVIFDVSYTKCICNK